MPFWEEFGDVEKVMQPKEPKPCCGSLEVQIFDEVF